MPDLDTSWRRWRVAAVLFLVGAFGAVALTTPTAAFGPTAELARDVALFTFTVGIACATTAVARWKGRPSALVWFLYAGLLWPVALVHALVMAPRAGAPADRSGVRS